MATNEQNNQGATAQGCASVQPQGSDSLANTSPMSQGGVLASVKTSEPLTHKRDTFSWDGETAKPTVGGNNDDSSRDK